MLSGNEHTASGRGFRRRRHGPLACVMGDVDLVRALGLGGIDVAVVAPSASPESYSRHVVQRVEPLDHWRHSEELAARLVAWARRQPEPPVLYYQTDGDLLLVSRHRDVLGSAFRFVLAEPELVEDLVDKGRFRRLAEQLDLPVPPAAVVLAGDGSTGLDHLGFPAVVKPLTRAGLSRIGTDAKAIAVHSRKELDSTLRLTSGSGVDVLVQHMVAGPESRIESYHAYVDDAGDTVAEFSGAKVRTHPPALGHTTALVITDREDVKLAGRSILERIGLRGVVKLDFKRDDRDRLWLLEANPRFNLWHHPGALAGANLPALVYADLVGLPRPRTTRIRTGVTWVHPYEDRWAIRSQGLPRRLWLRAALTSDCRWGADMGDPLPLVRGLVAPLIRRRLISRVGARGAG